MSARTQAPVAYAQAARRHLRDGETLYRAGGHDNAGQLFGFAAECGLKAMLVACGVPTDANGDILQGHRFRQHISALGDRLVTDGDLIPDGRFSAIYMAMLGNLDNFKDWSVDHRYLADAALSAALLAGWRVAAAEIMTMLDRAREDGVLP